MEYNHQNGFPAAQAPRTPLVVTGTIRGLQLSTAYTFTKARVVVAHYSSIQNLNYNLQLHLFTIFSGNSLGKKLHFLKYLSIFLLVKKIRFGQSGVARHRK